MASLNVLEITGFLGKMASTDVEDGLGWLKRSPIGKSDWQSPIEKSDEKSEMSDWLDTLIPNGLSGFSPSLYRPFLLLELIQR